MKIRKKALEQIDFEINEFVDLMKRGRFYSLRSEYDHIYGLINGYYQIDLISELEFDYFTNLLSSLRNDFMSALYKVHFVL